ncbi:hypothetical protein PseBG33_1624 [Pseudomonas synxantha BG33R]|uniref:SET domain-containing protein-lysine N-methyltransferase n=1 Tax=Pseudomonas synxantha TaxID=47883 RepID=UPI00025FF1FF|nr:SET domain-containing protein-lysine N-methyltransferase [Pseudomonas synxantha]EIK69198.1 hypothetical protein PseBG33_1624 [Pseudomonas synxantha BG33R]
MNTLTSPGGYTRPLAHSSLPVTPAVQPPEEVVHAVDIRAIKQPESLNAALAEHCNRRTLADKLQNIIQDLNRQLVQTPALSRAQMESALASQLKNTTMYVCDNSADPAAQPLSANRVVSLESYLSSSGTEVPKTLEALTSLQEMIAERARVHPLGNLGGGLSWPVQMPLQDQNSIITLMQSNSSGLPGLPLADSAKGALGYLISESSVSEADLKAPVLAMEKLLGSPKAMALGHAIRSRLDGIPAGVDSSDYVLTAIQLGLDPESLVTPARDTVAGFDLASRQHWGQTASAVIQRLATHLIENGRATAQTANLCASLLLARIAPQFLIKNIPASVTYASVLWTHLAMAVARIEARTPGCTLGMEYAEVLLAAEQLESDEDVSQQIDYQALRDWAVVNDPLFSADQTPSADAMERVRVAFNSHLSSIKTTSAVLQTPIPSRRADALVLLEEAFPGLDPSLFEVKTIQKARLKEGRPGLYPGMRSMLDIVMEGTPLGAEDHWISNDKRLPIDKVCSLGRAGKLSVAASFKTAFDAAINTHEEAHQGLVRHLISALPLEDRQNLEYGELEFFHTNQYTVAPDLFSPPMLRTRGHTLEMKATRNGQTNVYLIDTRRGVIEKRNYRIRRLTAPFTSHKMDERDADILTRTAPFKPHDDVGARQFKAVSDEAVLPDSFNSARSHAIARVFVKALDLKNDDLLNEARGTTSYDQDRSRNEAIGEFFLNLIPLRSAIVNFRQGNVGQGLFDLALDVVGLLTVGVGKAAQTGKVLGKALSSTRHAAKAARFVGATMVDALNPLSGVGDLLVGGGRLATKGGSYVRRQLKQLRGTAGRYDVLKAASKQYGDAATGAFNVAGDRVRGGAVLHNGKWYAFDSDTMRAYGRPLDSFTPDIHAVDGLAGTAYIESGVELSNTAFSRYEAPKSKIAGLVRNSQGLYVAADGHLSHIRHIDSDGRTAVYEVRQVTRTQEGVVQARIYHNNRQTELLVQQVHGDQWQRLGSKGGVIINADHLRAWEALSPQEQQKITVRGFARQHKIHPPTFAYYLDGRGGLSDVGKIVRDRPNGTPAFAIRPDHLLEWQGMTQQARDTVTMQGFAARYNLDLGDFRNHARQDASVGPAAQALFFKAAGGTYTKIADTHLQQWSQLAQQPGNKVTPAAFQAQHNLSPLEWSWFVRIDGSLTTEAVRRVGRIPPAVSPMSTGTLSTSTSTSPPALPGRKRPASDFVEPSQQEPLDLSMPRPETAPVVKQQAQVPEPSSAAGPSIKTEPGVMYVRTLAPHQIDNSLPILQDPRNPGISLTRELEGAIDDIRITYWNELLDGMSAADRNSVGSQIKESIKDWLRSERQHGTRFDDTLEVMTPLDDEGPVRGASVFARRDIPRFEVLGPYSGKYYPNQVALFEEERKKGSRAVLTYLFGTRSRERTVSALNSGNTLSLVNTSQLRGGPVWQTNNVVSISVGKNLTFFVANKHIKKGDELLMDYGPYYQPIPDIAIKKDPET